MDYAKESLRLHEEWRGKIEVASRVPVSSREDLSLAYTPGVAQPCLEIQKDVDKSYELTRRHNLCLVVTDGSAVLGLGDIGPEAGMPVMEGKCVLFKEFGDVDAFPLCIKSKDVDEIVNTIYLISGSFGGFFLFNPFGSSSSTLPVAPTTRLSALGTITPRSPGLPSSIIMGSSHLASWKSRSVL